MQFPNINKFPGFVFSIPFIGLYCYAFYAFNMYNFGYWPSLEWWSTRLLIAGAVLHMMLYLKHGGWLTFGTKRTETWWEDGVCFAPNLLHFTVSAFEFAIFWGVKVDNEENYDNRNTYNVHINPQLATTRHNVQMSHAAATIDRGLTAFFLWLFVGWKQGESHLTLMRFGFRLMFVAYVMAIFNGAYTHGTRHATQLASNVTATVQETAKTITNNLSNGLGVVSPPPPSKEKVMVSVQLEEGPAPIMPGWESFIPTRETKYLEYVEMEGDARKYLLYSEPTPSSVHSLYVNKPLCQVVPPGREVHFFAERPPTNAEEMEPWVVYWKRRGAYSFREWVDMLVVRRRWEEARKVAVTWKYLHDNWDSVHPELSRITGQAKAKYEIDKESNGGIVCF